MRLSESAEQFEKDALANDSLEMNTHLYLEINNDDVVKSVSVKNAHAIKTGILYKDGSFESRSCFKGYSLNYYTTHIHIDRPRDKDTLLLLQELGWIDPNKSRPHI